MEQNLSNQIICYVCGKTLSSKQANFRRHLKDRHGIIESVNYSVKCEEPSCDYMCSKVGELRTHLQSVHKLDQQVEELHFTNFEDFMAWKQSEEIRTKSRWVIHSRNTPNTTHYFCNRSGNMRTRSTEERKRMLKAQGTCKINATCTSYMSVKDTNGSLQVMFYKSHYGHEVKLEHIRLNQCDKNFIATQLIQGVSSTEILNKIRESVGEEFERIHLVNKKDIQNIAQTYKINDGAVRDQNDAVSVDMWVKNSSNIILYKKQGEIDTTNVFNKEDFLLAFMTTSQKELLHKFGNEGIICMDTTHGTNPYDFKLITILTVDDFEEGFPVAFLFSNREDYTALKYFVSAVQDRAGDVAAKMFMSDDAEQYFAAWSSIMSSNHTKKLLCAWHVDKSWRNKISIIKNKEKREQVYKMLCVLRQEVEEIQFEELLTSFTQFLGSDEELGAFATYFSQHYASRSKVWATAYRVGSGINTNMYLESMHKTIKYIYLDGKVCRRLDKTIHALENFVRDKQFERVLTLTKGKNYNFVKRHARAIEDDKMIVAENNENQWSVLHSDDDNICDVVRSVLPEHTCQIKKGILNKLDKLKSELLQIQNYIDSIEDFDLLTNVTKQLSCIDLTGVLNLTSK